MLALHAALTEGHRTDASHGDILKAVKKCEADIGVILMTVQGLQRQVEGVVRCLGEEKEDDHGEMVGTGLVGRHMRLAARVDRRFRTFDDWRNYAVGFFGGASLLVLALWWVLKVRLAELLQP